MGNSLGDAQRGSVLPLPPGVIPEGEGPAQCHPVPKVRWDWWEKTQPSFPGDLDGPWRCPPSPAVTLRVALVVNFAVPPPADRGPAGAALFDVSMARL